MRPSHAQVALAGETGVEPIIPESNSGVMQFHYAPIYEELKTTHQTASSYSQETETRIVNRL